MDSLIRYINIRERPLMMFDFCGGGGVKIVKNRQTFLPKCHLET